MNKQKCYLFLGNIIDHYDTALFAFLSPLFGQLFFPEASPTAQLVRTFLLFYIAMFFRPLGGYLFGLWGDKFGRGSVLSYTLIGMGSSSLFIAFIPTYSTIGPASCLLLLFGRCLQNFFSAGESISAALFLVEEEHPSNKDFMSGLLGASTVLGILICSLATTLLFQFKQEENLWRLLYIIGGFCSILVWMLRVVPKQNHLQKVEKKLSWLSFISVIAGAGFSYCIYVFCFVTLRSFIPLVTTFSTAEISWISTECLILDLVLLAFFGWVAKMIGRDALMISSALLGPLICYALSNTLTQASITTVYLYMALAVAVGTSYAAPFVTWMSSALPEGKKGRYGSLAYSLGAQLIGGPAAATSFAIYDSTKAPESITYYLIGSGAVAAFLQLYLVRGKLMNFAREFKIPLPLRIKFSKLSF